MVGGAEEEGEGGRRKGEGSHFKRIKVLKEIILHTKHVFQTFF